MLHHFVQGYVDAVYVATHLRAPPVQPQSRIPTRDGDENAPSQPSDFSGPIEAQVATFCEALFGLVSPLIRTSGFRRRHSAGSKAQAAPSDTSL